MEDTRRDIDRFIQSQFQSVGERLSKIEQAVSLLARLEERHIHQAEKIGRMEQRQDTLEDDHEMEARENLVYRRIVGWGGSILTAAQIWLLYKALEGIINATTG